MFRPADADDLAAFMAAKPTGVAITVLGVGSNLLVRDGIPGVVIGSAVGSRITAVDAETARQRGRARRERRPRGAGRRHRWPRVPIRDSRHHRRRGMNAGAYGSEIEDAVVSARAVDGVGDIRDLAPPTWASPIAPALFRPTGSSWSAVLRGRRDDPQAIGRRMQAIRDARESTQPIRSRTGGSTFANPPAAGLGSDRSSRVPWFGHRRRQGFRAALQLPDQHRHRNGRPGGAGRGGAPPRPCRNRVVLSWEIHRVGVPAEAVFGLAMSKHVAVLMGGWSSERQVSLVSGAAVAKALAEGGYESTRSTSGAIRSTCLRG